MKTTVTLVPCNICKVYSKQVVEIPEGEVEERINPFVCNFCQGGPTKQQILDYQVENMDFMFMEGVADIVKSLYKMVKNIS